MKTVNIPASLDEAIVELTGIGELITAKDWHRAAIVAAFVRLDLGHGGRKETPSSGDFMSAAEFSKLGIIGLRSDMTVARYVKAWLAVHDDEYPRLGQPADLPDSKFPPDEANLGSRTTKTNIGAQIKADPVLAAAAAEAVAEVVDELPAEPRERLGSAVDREREHRATRRPKPKPARSESSLDDDWANWLSFANVLFLDGARLAERSEASSVVLGAHAAAALELYNRLTERRIDAEFRRLLDSEGAS